MEPKEGLNSSSGVLADVQQNSQTASAVENSSPVVQLGPPIITAASPMGMAVPTLSAAAGMGTDGLGKKKRGRPRKYAANGGVTTALSPMPISASVPFTGPREFSAWKPARDKPFYNNFIKQSSTKFEFETPGEKIEHFVGANFTAHVLTVNAAAGPVQVVIGSFILGHQHEQPLKKHRIETPSVITTPAVVTTPTVNVISANDLKVSYGGIKPMMSASAFHQHNSTSPSTVPPGFMNSVIDNKTSSLTQDSRELSQSNCEVSS
ncbi:hypothetical protein ACFE04_027279 [Oxalis oulophora]